jgi:hypothetical protein
MAFISSPVSRAHPPKSKPSMNDFMGCRGADAARHA